MKAFNVTFESSMLEIITMQCKCAEWDNVQQFDGLLPFSVQL